MLRYACERWIVASVHPECFLPSAVLVLNVVYVQYCIGCVAGVVVLNVVYVCQVTTFRERLWILCVPWSWSLPNQSHKLPSLLSLTSSLHWAVSVSCKCGLTSPISYFSCLLLSAPPPPPPPPPLPPPPPPHSPYLPLSTPPHTPSSLIPSLPSPLPLRWRGVPDHS